MDKSSVNRPQSRLMGILKESYMETAILIGKKQYLDGDISDNIREVFLLPMTKPVPR